MGKLEDTRNSFTKLRGGKLISVEAIILGLVVCFILMLEKNVSPFLSLGAAFIVGFIFPILVGIFKSFAWLASILFSAVWGILALIIAGALANSNILVGLLVGLIVFAISFIVHKNYAGLSFQGVKKKNRDSQTVSVEYKVQEKVSFCSKCGRRIRTIDGRCEVCDK